MPKVLINNAEIYYEVKGQGSPILFTHGASLNHKFWKPQVDYFSQCYKVITWDIRGHGYSSLPDGEINSSDFRLDLIGILDLLEIKSATLCGLSVGGHISLQVAAKYPTRVQGLILIGTTYTNSNLLERFCLPLYRLSNRLLPKWIIGKIQGFALSRFNTKNKNYVEESLSHINHKNLIHIWDAVTQMESKYDLDNIMCPTLLLHGEQDYFTVRQQKFIVKKLRRVEFKTINNANHLTNLDNPTEVNRHIEVFLKNIYQ